MCASQAIDARFSGCYVQLPIVRSKLLSIDDPNFRDMEDPSNREKDILLIGIAIQLSIFALLVLSPLMMVSVILFVIVVLNETIRRLDEYSDAKRSVTAD